ncbi:MAG: ABC transporter permease [Anaerolineae bacterium]|nr:ABC transporter permease [Anaerolineae bacterium]
MDTTTFAQIWDVLQRYVFNIANLQGMLRLATPVILAGLCALITSRAGILNIAGEGIMLFGAWFGVAGSYFFESAIAGLVAAMLSGFVIGGLFALFSLKFKANIIVMGIAINIFAVAATIFLTRVVFGTAGAFADPRIAGFDPIEIPLLKDIPIIGPLLSGYTFIIYLTWILVGLTAIFLYRTPWGLHLRAVGENPEAAETLGINVERIRFGAVMASGVFASLGGVYLSLGHLQMFTDQMSAGRGFIGMAVNTFGGGEPVGVMLASFLFGFVDTIGWRLQGERLIPVYFISMLPYLVTLIALTVFTLRKKRARMHAMGNNNNHE